MNATWPSASTAFERVPGYLVALTCVAGAVVLNAWFWTIFEQSRFMLLLLAIFLAAFYGGLGPGLAATGASVLLMAFLFMPPVNALAVEDLSDALRLVLFGGVGLMITWITTGRRRSERRLAISEGSFHLFVDGVRDYAIFIMDVDGHIRSWNEGARRIKGYEAREIIGKPYSIFFTDEDRAAREPEDHLAIAARDGVWHGEGWRLRKDGSRFWADATLTAIRDRSGAHIGYGKVTRDLTERREAEERLQRAYGELEQRVQERTEKLDQANQALEAFADAIAHDVRGPLRTMEGLATVLLEDEQQLTEQGRRYLMRVRDSAQSMSTLTTELLSYSRLASPEGASSPVPLQAVVAEVITSLKAEVEERGARLEVASDLPIVQAHRQTLREVILNFMTNALKFVAPGVKPVVGIEASRRGSIVRLSVKDNGIGVPPDKVGAIFKPLLRLHGPETYPGTGMGLAIARRGATRMGGTVGVEPRPEGGSEFWIELPAAGRDRETTTARKS